MAKKIYPCPYLPPTPQRKELVDDLVARVMVFTTDEDGKSGPQLLLETDPAFKKLKEPLCGLYPGIQIVERPLGTLVGLMSPDDLVRVFGSLAGAVEAGHTMRHGGAILYGLQTAASRYKCADLAELLVMAAATVRIFFQYSSWTVRTVPTDRLDAALLKLTDPWNPGKDLLVWGILEDHDHWSAQLSRRILDGIVLAGSQPRHHFFTWGGNGLAENIHPSVIPEALVTLKPWAKDQANAKRWTKKLKARQKASAAE